MVRIAFAVLITAALASAGPASAACPDGIPKTHQAKKRPPSDPCVNFSAVPQISAQVVAAEPAPLVKPKTYTAPTQKSYEGPTLGLSKPEPGVKPVPTVGYHWSLD